MVLLPAGSPGDPCLGTNSPQQGYAVGDVAEAVLHSSLGTFSHVNCSLHYCASHNEQPGLTTPNLKRHLVPSRDIFSGNNRLTESIKLQISYFQRHYHTNEQYAIRAISPLYLEDSGVLVSNPSLLTQNPGFRGLK
jgi:hypothetical protein